MCFWSHRVGFLGLKFVVLCINSETKSYSSNHCGFRFDEFSVGESTLKLVHDAHIVVILYILYRFFYRFI